MSPTTPSIVLEEENEDTGFPECVMQELMAWFQKEKFKTIITPEQYRDRAEVLALSSQGQALCDIRANLPQLSTSFILKSLRLFSATQDHALLFHGRKDKGPLCVVQTTDIMPTVIQAHNAIHHQGTNKTWYEISSRYYGIPKRVADFVVAHCTICLTQRRGPCPAPIQAIESSAVMERVQIDLIDMMAEPDGSYHWILHIKDHFSRFCMLYPLERQDKHVIVQRLQEWIAMMGPPAILQTDNGEELVNEAIEHLAGQHHICIRRGRIRHPRSQGMVERANGHVRALIAKWCRRFHRRSWAESLPAITMACNMSVHTTIGKTPYEVVFCRKPCLHRAQSKASTVPPSDTDDESPQRAAVDGKAVRAAMDDSVRAATQKKQTQMVHDWMQRHDYRIFETGTFVSISVQGIDRSPLDDYRMPGIVVGYKPNRGYRICTQWGTLKRSIPIRHVLPLPAGHTMSEEAISYAQAPRSAPRVSLRRILRTASL